jgi:hypothetical protein
MLENAKALSGNYDPVKRLRETIAYVSLPVFKMIVSLYHKDLLLIIKVCPLCQSFGGQEYKTTSISS